MLMNARKPKKSYLHTSPIHVNQRLLRHVKICKLKFQKEYDKE